MFTLGCPQIIEVVQEVYLHLSKPICFRNFEEIQQFIRSLVFYSKVTAISTLYRLSCQILSTKYPEATKGRQDGQIPALDVSKFSKIPCGAVNFVHNSRQKELILKL